METAKCKAHEEFVMDSVQETRCNLNVIHAPCKMVVNVNNVCACKQSIYIVCLPSVCLQWNGIIEHYFVMAFSCWHLGPNFPSTQAICSLKRVNSQCLHAQVHVSLLCPIVEQLEQLTSWCLGRLGSLWSRCSIRFCFCGIWVRACSPLCELHLKKSFIIVPCWVNGSRHPCIYIRSVGSSMINWWQ